MSEHCCSEEPGANVGCCPDTVQRAADAYWVPVEQYDTILRERDNCLKSLHEFEEQYDALQAEVARLREALEWYAALGSWSIDRTGLSPAHRDMGQRARRFLAEPAAPQPDSCPDCKRPDTSVLGHMRSCSAAPQPEEGNAG